MTLFVLLWENLSLLLVQRATALMEKACKPWVQRT